MTFLYSLYPNWLGSKFHLLKYGGRWRQGMKERDRVRGWWLLLVFPLVRSRPRIFLFSVANYSHVILCNPRSEEWQKTRKGLPPPFPDMLHAQEQVLGIFKWSVTCHSKCNSSCPPEAGVCAFSANEQLGFSAERTSESPDLKRLLF